MSRATGFAEQDERPYADADSGYRLGEFLGSVEAAAAGSYFGDETPEVWKGAGSQPV